MYSSPTSGYPNDATKATISVTYGTTPSVTFATDVSATTLFSRSIRGVDD